MKELQFDPSDEEARRNGIGGNDAYAAAGIYTDDMKKWALTQYELFCIKIGRLGVPDLSDNEFVKWGSWLEGPVIDKINKETKYQIRRDTSTRYSKDYPFMYAHFDGTLVGNTFEAFGSKFKNVIAEIKCPSHYSIPKYGEEGTNEIPIWQLMQCVHYLVVQPKADAVFVFVQFPHNPLRLYVVKRNDKLINDYIKASSRFWAFVEEAKANPKMKSIGPPAISEKDLTLRNWDHEEKYCQLGVQGEIELKEMRQKEAEIKELQSQVSKHRFNLIDKIGSHQGGIGSDGTRLTLSRVSKRHYTENDVKSKFPDIYSKCTKFDKSQFREKYSNLIDEICEIRCHTQLKIKNP